MMGRHRFKVRLDCSLSLSLQVSLYFLCSAAFGVASLLVLTDINLDIALAVENA